MTKQEIIELLEYERDKANKERIVSAKLASNSYGAGADWGSWFILNEILEEIYSS